VTDPRTQATRTSMGVGDAGASGMPAWSGPSGWVFFASIIMFVVGTFNVIYGLAAIFKDEVLGSGGIIVWDVSSWGWVHLILGIALILTALGLWAGQEWARWVGLLFVMLNAIEMAAYLTVNPFWSFLIITLDIIIIYQLTVRWEHQPA
jgi:hypothetical protein